MNKHLPHLTTAIGVLLIVLAALLADQRTRLHYERAEVRTSRDVTGSVHASQEALAEVVAMSLPVEDFLQKPTHTNPERGSARVRHQAAVLRVLTGARRGMLVPANNLLHFSPSATALLSPGRRLHVSVTMAGDRVDEVLIYKPIVRFPAIIGLAAALLCLAVIALGRRGLALVAGLAVVVTGLSLVLFPLILRGVHPVAAGAIFGTAVLAVFGVFLGGRGRKGLAAVLGAAGGLAVAAACVLLASGPLRLSGFPSTISIALRDSLPAGTDLSFVGLLSAGAMICILGMVLDLGVSIAAAVEALHREQGIGCTSRSFARDAMAAGMRMSRDVTGTMLLTLFFVWAGENLHAWLLPDALGISVRELLNGEAMAVEVLGLVAAGIGMTAAGPLTALAAVMLLTGTLGVRRPAAEAPAGSDGGGVRGAADSPRSESPWPLRLVLAGEAVLCVACGIAIARGVYEVQRIRPDSPPAAIPALRSADDYAAYAAERAATGRDAEAIAALWRGLAIQPGHGPSHYELARIFMNRRWIILAHADAAKAVAAMPQDSNAHYVAGVVHAWLGDSENAERELRKAVELNPKNASAEEALKTLFENDEQ